MKAKHIIWIAFAMFLVGMLMNLLFIQEKSCTIFTLQDGDEVYFASNEDWHSGELYLGFTPATINRHGAMRIGYMIGNRLHYQSAINDQGLAWAVNSVPAVKMKYSGDQQYNMQSDNFFTMITENAASVDEAVALSKQFDFGEKMKLQIHIADKAGNAVVISPGADGTLAYTKKSDGYLLSTNFDVANIENVKPDWRYENADRMLINREGESLDAYAASILNQVSLNNITTYTMISSVTNLYSGDTTVFYMSQFNEGATFNIYEAIKKGQRVISMRELYSQSTVTAGDIAYKQFERRFNAAKVVVIAFGTGIVLLIFFKLKKRFRKN